jgi:hypothetical protein
MRSRRSIRRSVGTWRATIDAEVLARLTKLGFLVACVTASTVSLAREPVRLELARPALLRVLQAPPTVHQSLRAHVELAAGRAQAFVNDTMIQAQHLGSHRRTWLWITPNVSYYGAGATLKLLFK